MIVNNLINVEGSCVDITGETHKTSLLDADSIIYIVGSQQKDSYDEAQVKFIVDNFITDIFITTGATQYAGFFSSKETFRHRVYPEYKGKRPEPEEWLKRWKPIIIQHCVDYWNFVITEDSEADDAVAILQNNMLNTTICSPDKDLKNIVGMNYDYKKGIFTYIDEATAKYNWAIQMLTGDVVDAIKGVKGIGKVGAEKLLKDIPTEDLEEKVKQIYLEKSTLEDYELHRILIGIGEHEPFDKYMWDLNTFDLDNAEPSEKLKEIIERRNNG